MQQVQIKKYSINQFFLKKNVSFYVGDDTNVLRRFYKSAIKFNVDIIVRITGDSILIDYRLVDKLIKKFSQKSRLFK